MVRFRHDAPGTEEAAWRAWPGLTDAPRAALPDLDVVLLAAHPDDETLGAGGLLAALGDRGREVTVVMATAGEGSHPSSPTTPAQELAQRRRREARDALDLLAPKARLVDLGLPDGGLADQEEACEHAVEAVLAEGFRAGGPGGDDGAPDPGGRREVLLVAPWRGDGHPDHEALGRVAHRLAQRRSLPLWEYPVWAWHWSRPGEGSIPWRHAVRWELDPAGLERKRAAIAAHRTQVAALSPLPGDEALLSPEVLAHFARPYEVFLQQRPSIPVAHFDRLYGASRDPWGFETRWYERRKRALTLAALPRQSFRRAFEPGCSIGVLTAELAPRCGELVAMDPVSAAVGEAIGRTSTLGHVSVVRGAVPGDWPPGTFDLVMLSELGYYCGPEDLQRLVDLTAASLDPDGVVVACHWLHPSTDHPVTTEAVHAALAEHPRLTPRARYREADFLLDVLERVP